MAAVIDAILRLSDRFTPTLANVNNRLREHQATQKRTADSIRATGKAISGMGSMFGGMSIALSAAATAGVSLQKNFAAGMRKVNTLIDSNVVSLQKLSDGIVNVSKETGVAVTELAEAEYQAISASVPVEHVTEVLRVASKAAVGGATTVTAAVDGLTNAMNGFHIPAERAAQVSDAFFTAVKLGKTSMEALSSSIGTVASTAYNMGVSLDEVMAGFAAITKQGVDTATAATQMGRLMDSITKPGKEALEVAQKIGIEFSRAGVQAAGGLIPFITKIKEATNGNQEMIAALFNQSVARKGFQNLTSDVGDLNNILQQTREAAGASAEAFDKMKNPMQIAQNNIALVGRELGKALMPLLTRTAKITQMMVDEWNKLSDSTKELIVNIGVGIVSFTVLTGIVGKGIVMFADLYETILALPGTFLKFKDAITGGFSALRSMGAFVGGPFRGIFGSIGGILTAPFRVFGATATTMFNVLQSGAPISTVLSAGFNRLRLSLGLLNTGSGTFIAQFIARFAALRATIGGHITGIIGFITRIPASIRNIPAAFTRLVGAARQLLNLRNIFTILVNGFRAFSLALASNPVGIALLAIGAAALIVANNWDLFKNVAEVVWNKISYIVGDVIAGIKERFGSLAEHAQQVFGRLVEAWNTLTGSSSESGELITAVVNTLGSVFTAGFAIIASAVEFAVKNIFTIIDSLLTVFDGIITFITGVFTGNWSQAWEGVKTIFTGVIDGIKGIFGNFIDYVSNALARIRGEAANTGNEVKDAQSNAGGGEPPGKNALGTNFWRGGLTWVHEQGPEIIDLPTGARVIPHSKSLMLEYGRGLSDGMAMLPSASLPPISAYGNTIGGRVNDRSTGRYLGNVSDSDTGGEIPQGLTTRAAGGGEPQSKEAPIPERDELGNILSANIPEHNRITENDTEDIKAAKREAQDKAYAASIPQISPTRPAEGAGLPQSILQGEKDGGAQKSPSRAADGARKPIEVFTATPERDELGNILGANIPEHNRITPEDSLPVRAAKEAAQEKAYLQTAPMGGTQETEAYHMQTGEGNPRSNIKSGEKQKPGQAVTFNINIPKLADEIYVREKTDIEDIARQIVFQIRGIAGNRIQGAVR